MKYALYFLGTKIKESNSREYLITELYSMGKVYNAKGETWVDSRYEIKEQQVVNSKEVKGEK